MKKVVAFDIGGTSIRVAVVFGSRLSRFAQVPTPRSRKKFLGLIVALVEERFDASISGIGIGFPAQISNGKISVAPNVPLKNFDLKSFLSRKFRVKVGIHNDASCVALAEARFGCKKRDFVVVTLGTGIGGGMVVNDSEYMGAGLGSEFGHILINGKFLESHWHDTRRLIKRKFGSALMSDLVNSKKLGSKKVLADTVDYLGQGIASLISVLDPEVVILAGGVRECGSKFLTPLQKVVRKYSFIKRKTPIQWTSLEQPGILGASLLV